MGAQPLKTLDRLDQDLAGFSRALLSTSGSLLLLVILVGNLWSASACVIRIFQKRPERPTIQVRDADPARLGDAKVLRALDEAWDVFESSSRPTLQVAESTEINAASLGDGRFIVFEGTTEMTAEVIDGVVAHEVAHDVLRHARKAGELRDLSEFLAEAIAFFTRTDAVTAETMRNQITEATLPRYSRSQEYEADELAADILSSEGYDDGAKVMADTLRLLIQKGGDTGGGFFDTHPSTQQRIDALLRKGQK